MAVVKAHVRALADGDARVAVGTSCWTQGRARGDDGRALGVRDERGWEIRVTREKNEDDEIADGTYVCARGTVERDLGRGFALARAVVRAVDEERRETWALEVAESDRARELFCGS